MAMKEGLIGRKVGMTQVFGDDGNMIPVTVVQLGPCTVVSVRTKATHGYDALQLGFEAKKKNVTKAMAGVYKKAGLRRADDDAAGDAHAEDGGGGALHGGAGPDRRYLQPPASSWTWWA